MDNNEKTNRKHSKHGKFRYGTYAIVASILVVAALVVLNIAATAVEDNWALRWDLSFNSLTKFSETTKNALSGLEQDVTFYVFATPGSENAMLTEVLDRYRAANAHVTFTVIDPDKNPGLVSKFRTGSATLSSNAVAVTNADETRFKLFSLTDMVNYGQDSSGNYYVSSYKFEQVLTQGMLYVTAAQTPTAYLLQGHGEPTLSELSAMATLLRANNYDVAELPLGSDMPAPHGNVLVIAAPVRDLEDQDRQRIMEFAQNGGGFLFAWDAATSQELANFNAILDFFNIGYEDGIVIANVNDSTQFYYAPTYLLSVLGDHDIVTPLAALRTPVLSMQSRAVAAGEMTKNEVTVTPLLLSAQGSFLADINATRTDWTRQDNEPAGPFTLAAAVLRRDFADSSRDSRAVVLGSVGSIASSSALNSFSNGEFLLSAAKWAAKDEAVNISILSKVANRTALNITSQAEIFLLAGLSLLLLPLAILIAGMVVNLRRRHL